MEEVVVALEELRGDIGVVVVDMGVGWQFWWERRTGRHLVTVANQDCMCALV